MHLPFSCHTVPHHASNHHTLTHSTRKLQNFEGHKEDKVLSLKVAPASKSFDKLFELSLNLSCGWHCEQVMTRLYEHYTDALSCLFAANHCTSEPTGSIVFNNSKNNLLDPETLCVGFCCCCCCCCCLS